MSSQDTMLNSQLGDYTIKRLIAKGGMGRVYEAIDNQLDRSVAVKVITLEEEAADELMMRFQREAKAIGQLDNHPNIVTIYRYGKDAGVTYIAMQFVRGESMGEYLRRLHQTNQLIEVPEMLHLLRQIASALDHAHGLGVIHRDVKPANVMLTEPDKNGHRQAILMDFGLVLRVDNTMTTGSAFGTPRYIAPEQALSSADACPESDIYALGIMVYEMLAGRPPFDDEETPIGLALSHVTKQPPNPQEFRPQIPDAVVPVLMKVLEKEPKKRFSSASEFVEAVAVALNTPLPKAEIVVTSAEAPSIPERDQTLVQAPHISPPSTEVPIPQAKVPVSEPQKKNNALLPVFGVIVLGIIVMVGFALLSSGGDNNAADEPAPAVSGEGGRLELVYTQDILLIRNLSSDQNAHLNASAISLKQGNRAFNFGTYAITAKLAYNRCISFTLTSNKPNDPFVNINNTTCPASSDPKTERNPNNSDYVWNSGDSFVVEQNGEELATCQIAAGKCTVQGVNLVP